MIYFEDSLKILKLFSKSKILDFEHINNKSGFKTNEAKQILNYLLYYNYIDLINAQYQITVIGERFVKCFSDYEKETMLVLNRLNSEFPKTLTKKDCSEGIPSLIFKEIILYLKEKGFVQMVSTTTSNEMVRTTEYGFLLIDYINLKKKMYQLLD
jgi:predicted transcriptional regulator